MSIDAASQSSRASSVDISNRFLPARILEQFYSHVKPAGSPSLCTSKVHSRELLDIFVQNDATKSSWSTHDSTSRNDVSFHLYRCVFKFTKE
jgi:hypothetical protein